MPVGKDLFLVFTKGASKFRTAASALGSLHTPQQKSTTKCYLHRLWISLTPPRSAPYHIVALQLITYIPCAKSVHTVIEQEKLYTMFSEGLSGETIQCNHH